MEINYVNLIVGFKFQNAHSESIVVLRHVKANTTGLIVLVSTRSTLC